MFIIIAVLTSLSDCGRERGDVESVFERAEFGNGLVGLGVILLADLLVTGEGDGDHA